MSNSGELQREPGEDDQPVHGGSFLFAGDVPVSELVSDPNLCAVTVAVWPLAREWLF